MPNVNTRLTSVTAQSQPVAVSLYSSVAPAGQPTWRLMPTAWLSGSQNTLMP